MICFGALPAVIVYILSDRSDSGFYLSGIYLLCALIRLAWFNVDEEERQELSDGAREVYYGLPVTTAALMIPALVGLCRLCRWPVGILGPLALLAMGSAFLIPFRGPGVLQLIQRTRADRLAVRFLCSRWSRPLAGWYAKRYRIPVSPERLDSFRSFRDFFYPDQGGCSD